MSLAATSSSNLGAAFRCVRMSGLATKRRANVGGMLDRFFSTSKRGRKFSACFGRTVALDSAHSSESFGGMLIAAPRYESRAPLGYSFGRVFLPNRLLDILALVSAECLLPVCAARRLARPSGERALVLILALALARISGGMLRCAARILAQASAERFIPLSAAPILALFQERGGGCAGRRSFSTGSQQVDLRSLRRRQSN